jgi:DNA/RNA endonuclease YhcR with UshA esterase domain
MRTLMSALLLFLVWLPLAAAEEVTKPIGPEEAAKKVGETVTLKMEVKSATLREDIAFLNSEKDFKDSKNFLVFLDKAAVEKFKEAKIDDPAEHFKGKTIEVHGKIVLYHERPEIKVTDPEQIKIVEAK